MRLCDLLDGKFNKEQIMEQVKEACEDQDYEENKWVFVGTIEDISTTGTPSNPRQVALTLRNSEGTEFTVKVLSRALMPKALANLNEGQTIRVWGQVNETKTEPKYLNSIVTGWDDKTDK